MRVLFIERNPELRMDLHDMALMMRLDHVIASTLHEAMALLAACPDDVEVVATSLHGWDLEGERLPDMIRSRCPRSVVFGYGEPETAVDSSAFDKLFIEPYALPAMFCALEQEMGVYPGHSCRKTSRSECEVAAA